MTALVVDIGYMKIEQNKYQGIIEEGMKSCLEKQDVNSFKKVTYN